MRNAFVLTLVLFCGCSTSDPESSNDGQSVADTSQSEIVCHFDVYGIDGSQWSTGFPDQLDDEVVILTELEAHMVRSSWHVPTTNEPPNLPVLFKSGETVMGSFSGELLSADRRRSLSPCLPFNFAMRCDATPARAVQIRVDYDRAGQARTMGPIEVAAKHSVLLVLDRDEQGQRFVMLVEPRTISR